MITKDVPRYTPGHWGIASPLYADTKVKFIMDEIDNAYKNGLEIKTICEVGVMACVSSYLFLLLNPNALDVGVHPNLGPSSATTDQNVYYNNTANSSSLKLFEVIKAGDDFEARRTENVSTSHYFIRANNREFNFSNNPTFVTGSAGEFAQGLFERDPHVYITSVGLYDDASELLAVAKLSTPVEKTFDKEIAIKVKLDF
jgi:hypothetical protein